MHDPSPTTGGTTEPYRWRWLVLVVMLVAEIMDLLDASIVNVAGPELEESLGAGSAGLQWVIGGYAPHPGSRAGARRPAR